MFLLALLAFCAAGCSWRSRHAAPELLAANGSLEGAGYSWSCASAAPAGTTSIERSWLDSKVESFKVRWE